MEEQNNQRVRSTVINIGISGNSGTGKSSFINALRSLSDDHYLAAPVGVTETTVQPRCYTHPDNPSLRLWDLPGITNMEFSQNLDEYCGKVDLGMYDSFLLFSAVRFTENDRLMANAMQILGKRFLFIRTKIDSDLRAEWRKRSFNADNVLDKIRADCIKNLNNVVRSDDIYLISNHYTTQWDFDKLAKDILNIGI